MRRSRIRAQSLSPAERATLATQYQAGDSVGVVARRNGFSHAFVARLVKEELGITGPLPYGRNDAGRSYTLNQRAFDAITEQSAYWVGMLMTDGCISQTGPASAQVILSLKSSDVSHIVSLRTFLGSDVPLIQERPRTSAAQGQIRLCVCSLRLSHALARFGVVPRKTHTAAVCLLETNRHFWRGAIDGDGSVCFYRRTGYPVLSLCGASLCLIEQFASYCRSLYPTMRAKPRRDGRGTIALTISGPAAITVIRKLYGDCTIALPRKQTTAQTILAMADADPMWCRRKGQFPRKPHTAETRRKMSEAARRRVRKIA